MCARSLGRSNCDSGGKGILDHLIAQLSGGIHLEVVQGLLGGFIEQPVTCPGHKQNLQADNMMRMIEVAIEADGTVRSDFDKCISHIL